MGLIAPVVVLAMCACGARSGPAPTPLPAGAPPAQTVVASDSDNGHVLTLRVGQHLRLVLSSISWNVAGSSDPAVLRQSGTPAVSPRPSGCVPGSGCGTVTTVFDAIAPGRSEVRATRTTCGEAAGCTGSSAAYRVTVVVTG